MSKRGLTCLLTVGLALAGCGEAGAGSYMVRFSDDFSLADGLSLDSANWNSYVPSGATFRISSSQAKPIKGTGDQPAAWYKTSISDTNSQFLVELDATSPYADNVYLVARSDASTGAPATGYACGITEATHKLEILLLNSGAVLAASSATFTLSGRYQLTFTLEGGSLTCAISGTSGSGTVKATDTTQTAGYVGLQGGTTSASGGALYLDNFKYGTR
jgi:hypothetical protein